MRTLAKQLDRLRGKAIFLAIVAILAATPALAQANRIISTQEIGGWSLLLLQDTLSDEKWQVLMLRDQGKEFESLNQKVTATLTVTCSNSSDYKGPQAALWFSKKIAPGKVLFRFDEGRVWASSWEPDGLIANHQFVFGGKDENFTLDRISGPFVSTLKSSNRLRMSPKFQWTTTPPVWEFDIKGSSQAIDALRCGQR